MTQGRAPLGGTAVVCGAGIAGLLTARVLSEFFHRVVIIERDQLADEPGPRRGVPQGSQVHILLTGGQRILDDLFPKFVDDMVAQGGHFECLTSARKRYQAGRWAPRPASDLWTVFCSRGLLESVVRQRVLELPNVTLQPERRVTGVVTSAGKTVVCGVETRSATNDDHAIVRTHGDLIIDATGRTSAGPKWLESLGYEPPDETIVNGFWGYAGRSYRMPEDWDPGWSTLVSMPTGLPGDTRGAVWIKQEDGRWLLTLTGCAKDYPPRDERQFEEWLASLPVPDLAEPLAAATPLTEIAVWRQTFNRLRRYDWLRRQPERLLFLGDTVCTLNPVYGQGMTVAALSAQELRACLLEQANTDDGLDGLAQRFQRRLAERIRFSWMISSSADHAIPGAEGDPPVAEEAELGRRWRRAFVLAAEDEHVNRLFWETVMLVRTPDWLFTGGIADRLADDDLVPATT